MNKKVKIKVSDIAEAIEAFAPRSYQEDYDNAGLQVGDPEADVTGILVCLDVTEDVLAEAVRRDCNMIVSHHPLIFRGLKQLVGADQTQHIVIEALRRGIAIYSAHTNLDSACEGVSYEMAHSLGLQSLRPLAPREGLPGVGLGVIGETSAPIPRMEFLRKVKETFSVAGLRYSAQSGALVVRRVALCGGSGASLIGDALREHADVYITGDLKYHDFTTYGTELLLADIGHYESELCSGKILSRVIRDALPECVIFFADSSQNPVKLL